MPALRNVHHNAYGDEYDGEANIGSKLSAWIRDHAEAKRDPPEIHSGNIDAIESTLPDYTVAQKQLLLLRAIARRSDFPGKTVRLIPDHDFPLAWATNDTELHYYLQTTAVRTRIAPCTCSLTARLARWTVDGMSYSQWLRVSTQVFQRAFMTWFERKRANNRFDPDLRTTRFVRWSPGQPDALGSTKRMIDNED